MNLYYKITFILNVFLLHKRIYNRIFFSKKNFIILTCQCLQPLPFDSWHPHHPLECEYYNCRAIYSPRPYSRSTRGTRPCSATSTTYKSACSRCTARHRTTPRVPCQSMRKSPGLPGGLWNGTSSSGDQLPLVWSSCRRALSVASSPSLVTIHRSWSPLSHLEVLNLLVYPLGNKID